MFEALGSKVRYWITYNKLWYKFFVLLLLSKGLIHIIIRSSILGFSIG